MTAQDARLDDPDGSEDSDISEFHPAETDVSESDMDGDAVLSETEHAEAEPWVLKSNERPPEYYIERARTDDYGEKLAEEYAAKTTGQLNAIHTQWKQYVQRSGNLCHAPFES